MKYPYTEDEKMIRKYFYISRNSFSRSKEIANKMGIRYPEYIRHLISQDIRRYSENPLDTISEKEKVELKRIMFDIQRGNFISSRDIEKVLGRLLN